jgi:cyclase
MLKVRIIPTLLWKNHSLVKSKRFSEWRKVGHLVPSVKVYNSRNVDEIIFLNISDLGENQIPDYNIVDEVASHCFVPLTIGGNIRNLFDVQKIIERGADKISLNSILDSNIQIINEISKNFGSQAVVVSVDYRKLGNDYKIFFKGGKKKSDINIFDHIKKVEDLGAGELLLNSIDNDGMMNGYELDMLSQISKISNLPIIVSGGAGNYSHMKTAIDHGASAVSAASIFHFTEKTPEEAKNYLKINNIPIRKSIKLK